MEIKNNEKLLDSLVINKVPSRKIYNQMVKQGKVNNDEIYIVNKEDDLPYKYSFIAQEGYTTFIFPFTVENPEDLNIFFNGILMTKNINYTIQDNKIKLLDFAASANDSIIVLNIRGIEPEDYLLDVINDLQIIKNDTIQAIDNKISKLPKDMNEMLLTSKNNIMTTGKITMNSTYTPSNTGDLTDKKYVDQQIQNNKISKVSQLTNDAGYLTSHLVRSVNGMTGDISIKGAYVGSYIGNNALTKTLNFNFEPAYLMLFMVQTNAGTAQNYMCGIQGMKYPFPNNNGTYVSFTWNSKSVIITAASSYYTSILSYKGYFIRCNTKLYFDKYSKLCINNIYDKYIIIKNKYIEYVIFIKVKNRYYTYDKEDKGKYIILKGNEMEVKI